MFFDARSGALIGSQIPTGETSGDTVTMGLLTLHIAQIWGLPFRVFMTLIGLSVALLSVTGAYIWWKKRKARAVARWRQAIPAVQVDYLKT